MAARVQELAEGLEPVDRPSIALITMLDWQASNWSKH
jgi:hypothetical protein